MAFENLKADPELGLCLAGGGGLGFLHIGLFQTLEELGIRPGVIAGTSSGAVMGAFRASGKSAQETRKIIEGFKWFKIISPSIIQRRGIFTTTRMESFLRKNLGDIDIADLPIRLKIAALNLFDGSLAVFTKGKLVKCLAAAGAVPGVFTPVEIGDGAYYDAGGVFNLPLELFAGEGVKRIIAGNTIGRHGLMKHPRTAQDVIYQAYLIRSMHLSAMRTGPDGWEGRDGEELILIDYESHGARPTNVHDCASLIDDVGRQSFKILRKAF